MLRPAEVTRRGVTAFTPSKFFEFAGRIAQNVASGFVAAKPLWCGRGSWGARGESVMKNLIKNVLIGFGVGLVLVTGLSLIASNSSNAASAAHSTH